MLTAVEMGMRNHHAVPVELVVSIAGLRHARAVPEHAPAVQARPPREHGRPRRLPPHVERVRRARAAHAHAAGRDHDARPQARASASRTCTSAGPRGPSARDQVPPARQDLVQGGQGEARLSRARRSAGNWLYLSRLAPPASTRSCAPCTATRCRRRGRGDVNRHALCMTLVDGFPLYQVRAGQLAGPEAVFRCVRPHLSATQGSRPHPLRSERV